MSLTENYLLHCHTILTKFAYRLRILRQVMIMLTAAVSIGLILLLTTIDFDSSQNYVNLKLVLCCVIAFTIFLMCILRLETTEWEYEKVNML